MTWEREANEPGASFLEGLDVRAAPAHSADFVLCHGTEVGNHTTIHRLATS